MKGKVVPGGMSLLLVIMIGALSLAEAQPKKPAARAPTIEGTYKLISRQLPDGMIQRSPAIMGLLTYARGHRNFNVFWKDAAGKSFSYSLVSTYKLTPTGYSETLLFSILNDQIGGQEIRYDLSGQTRSVPLMVQGRRLQFKLPFDPVSVVFEGNRLTATAEGRFVDVWEKVR